MNLVKLSWRNLWYKPLGTVLSLVLVAFGVGLLSLISLFQRQFTDQFEKNQAGIDLVVGAKGSPLQLILNSMFHIDAPTGNVAIKDVAFLFNPKNPYIADAIPLSVGDSYRGFRIIGTNQDILDLYPAEMASGRKWEKDMEVTIGAQISIETGLQVGDSFYSSHGFNDGDLEHDEGEKFVVVGQLEPHGSVVDKLILCTSEAIWAVHEGHEHDDHVNHDQGAEEGDVTSVKRDSISVAKSFLDYPDKQISSVLVRFAADKRTAIPVINMPRNINENTPLMATSPPYELNKLMANVGTVMYAAKALALLIAIISGLSVFISLFNNLRERRQELAMMRVAGAKPRQLLLMILCEALLTGILGAIIGLVLAHVALFFISNMLDDQFHYSLDVLRIYPVEWLILSVTLVISIIAGLLPAFKAYKTNIIENLR